MISTWFILALFKSYFTSTLNKTCPIFKKKIDKKKLYQNIAVEVENDYYILNVSFNSFMTEVPII